MLAIKNNLMASGAARNLGKSYDLLGKSVQRLSSGLRINSAKDDAAGLAVRELIRADVAALQQGSRNAMDGVSMLQAAEGALGEIDAILVRMRELAEQAATDTYSATQKSIMQAEFDELSAEIDRIANTTDFNDINLLNSSTGSVKIGLGSGVSDTDKTISVSKTDLTASGLGVGGTSSETRATAIFDSTYSALMSSPDAADCMAYYEGTTSLSVATVSMTVGGEVATFTIGDSQSLTLNDLVDELNQDLTGVTASVATSGSDFVLQLQANDGDTDLGTVTWDHNGATNGVGQGLGWGTTGYYVTFASATTYYSSSVENVEVSQALQLTDGLDTAISALETAIQAKDEYRASLGYYMNRLEYAASVLDVQAENLLAAESRISDVDVATEMSTMTRNQVLAQAGISMLAQANSMPQMALSLLQ